MTDCPPDPPKGPDRCNTTFMENNTAIRDYFTEDEWDAIFSALSDYQDYGSEEAEQSRSAQSKISKLFNN